MDQAKLDAALKLCGSVLYAVFERHKAYSVGAQQALEALRDANIADAVRELQVENSDLKAYIRRISTESKTLYEEANFVLAKSEEIHNG